MVGSTKNFLLIFLFTTLSFSFFAYQPNDVVIVGPTFPQEDYFIEELNLISEKTGYKITYISLNDVAYYLQNNPDKADLALLTSPQSLQDLGNLNVLRSVNDFYDENSEDFYSNYLINLISSEDNSLKYGHWLRLFSNSMIWYNVERYKALGSPTFESFDEIIEFTNLNSTKDNELWCLSIDSAENQPLLDYEYGESAGWIVSNWLENIVLANYGTNIYDNWVKNDIKFSDDEITLSLLDIGKIVHSDGNVYRGKEYLIRSQVSTSAANLLDEDSSCVFSLMGHHAINHIPQSKNFVEDYDFFYFPSQDYSNMVVGIGDTVSLLNYDAPSLEVYAELISASFGQIWASKIDSQYVSARTDFDKNKYNNEFTKKEYIQIKDSLSMNLFRYDGSMLMEKGTGQKILWTTLRQFVTQSNDYLEQVTEEIDTRIKRELLGN